MIEFYKPILLPSNGLSYDANLNITQIKMSYVFAMSSAFFTNSSTELVYSFLRRFSDGNIDIQQMYWADAYYVWLYLLSDAFNLMNINVIHFCEKCRSENKVKVNLNDLELHIIKNKSQKLLSYKIKKEGHLPITVKYERRKIIHNIQCGNYILSERPKKPKDEMILLMKPQLQYILADGKKFSNEKAWTDLFNELNIKEIQVMLKALGQCDFGFKSNMVIDCKSCGHTGKIDLYSPYANSIYTPGNTLDREKISKVIDIAISLNKAKIASYSDVMNMTPEEVNIVSKRANELFSTAGAGHRNLDPEDFMEQFGVA